MSFQLTLLPAPTSVTDTISAILAYDLKVPDGATKEIIVRASAIGLFDGAIDPALLIQSHPGIELAVAHAIENGISVANAVVLQFVDTGLLGVRDGESEADAAVALAGMVADVLNAKALTIEAVKPPVKSAPVVKAVGTKPDIAELDLMSEQFEMLRVVLTRTLASVRPDLFVKYRAIKDSGTATARADAYQFAFGILATLIAQTKTTG